MTDLGLIEEVIEAATACGVSGIASDYADGILEMTQQMNPYSPSIKVDYDHHRPMEIYYLYLLKKLASTATT